jgi:hypothetical protein
MAVSRKITEGIYGGHQPRDVAAAVALGILAGALAGGNLSWAAVLLTAILFNVHTRLFLAAWLASVLIAWLSRGWLETLGQFLLDGTPLGRTVGLLGDSALAALLGWDEYALVGGLAAGTTAALACAPIAYWATGRLHRRWLQASPSASSSGAEPQERRSGEGRPLVRVWYGPSKHERAVRQTMAVRRLRPYGIPATLAAAVTVAVGSWSLARWSVEHELWRELSIYNGAEVTGARTELSLSSGDFVVHDLAIADAAHPERDRFRVGLAKGRLSPGLLLRGRLHVERIVLSRVRADVPRGQPARLCGAYDVSSAAEEDGGGQGHPPSAGDLEVSAYLRSWPSVCRRLGSLQKLVGAIERLARAEDELPQARGRWTPRRSDLGRPQPRVAVQELRVDNLPRAWNLGGKALVEIANLASNPSLAKKPAQVKILLPKFGAEAQLDFASDTGRPNTVRCSACDLDVGPWIDAPLAVSGQARLAGQGSFDGRGFEMRLLVEIEPLAAEVTCHEPLAGVEPALWNWGLRQMAAVKAEAVCSGPWASPVVAVDAGPLVAQLKRELRAAGHEGLADTFEQQIARHLERQAGLQDEQPAGPDVVQAAGIVERTDIVQPTDIVQATGIEVAPAPIEPQTVPSPSDLSESSSDDEYRTARDAEAPSPPVAQQADSPRHFSYPTTSFPDDDSEYVVPSVSPLTSVVVADFPAEAAPVATPAAGPTPRQPPLPGPMNMVVGRDRSTGPRTSQAPFGGTSDAAPRENVLSRWTQGLRRKFTQAFARPKEPAESLDSADYPPVDDDQAIPAAASDAWYNRRWR